MQIAISNRWILLAITIALSALVWSIYSRPETAQGGAFMGQIAKVATSSELHLETDEVIPIFGAEVNGEWLAFATSSTCTSRIVTTKTAPILLGFMDSATATQQYGHLQAASTTVQYDSEIYGCGRWTARTADDSNTIISVTELSH